MAKRKPTKKNEQPELSFDADAPAAATPAKGKKATPPAEGTPIGDSSAVLVPKTAPADPSTFNIQPSTDVAAAPAPKRPKGQKVQDEQAPLAQAYRNWFLD